MPVKSALGTNYTVTYATDRIGGFTAQAVDAARGLTSNPLLVGEPPLEIVVARHIGTAIYGNIGAANRLDFTVTGPAVNLVSRIEAMAKTLNLPIVVSTDFARMTWRQRSHKSCGKANGRLPSTNWLARASILMSR